MRLLSSLFDIRRDDKPTVPPALAFTFLGVGAMALAGIASDTIFVSTFDLGQISRFYIVVSLVRVAAAFGYASLRKRASGVAGTDGMTGTSGTSLDAALFAVTAVVMAASGALAQGASSAVLYAICVAQQVLPPLLPLVTFNAVASSLGARQAKRLLPLAAAAATAGTIGVGAAVPALARAFGAPGMLYAGSLLAALAAPLPRLLAARAARRGPPESSPPSFTSQVLADAAPPAPEPDRGAPDARSRSTSATGATGATGVRGALAAAGRDLRAAPVVGVVLAGAVMGAAATNFVDYAFKAALKARFERDAMAAFLGSFGVGSNLVVLGVQLFGTSRFVGRFGVSAALRSAFAALLAFGPVVGAAFGVASTTAAKLAETVFRYSFSTPVADLLLTPTAPGVRTRAKVLIKGAASPGGAALAGFVLAAFGAEGPPPWALGVLLVGTGAAGILAVAGAHRVYTEALADALGAGKIPLDVSPDQASALRREIVRTLDARVAKGDAEGAARALAVFTDRFFTLDDLARALRSERPAIRRAAVAVAPSVARPGEGPRLLDLAPPDPEPAIERAILASARSLGAEADQARLERALAWARPRETRAPSDPAGPDATGVLDLWAEALTGLASPAREASVREAAVKELRRAALGADVPRRIAALRALGDLREARAQKEVLLSLGAEDDAVFAEASRAAVLIGARGAVATLLEKLVKGSQVRAASRALALAGAAAVTDLIAALPTSRGEGAALPTAVASGHAIAGTVRAARILARLGPEACARVLGRFDRLGYRARDAVARAFATLPRPIGEAVGEGPVLRAMGLMLTYAEGLVPAYAPAAGALLRREIRHRIEETGARLLDLAAMLGDRELITRARAVLAGHVSEREPALELLENILPRALAARAVALLEMDWEVSSAPPSRWAKRPPLDGWLEKCRAFDENELGSDNPMLGVLEKVIVLRDSSLFTGLSGEELYPVAEIAEAVEHAAGDVVVRQGDPGDALFVVARGVYRAVRGEARLRDLDVGAVFGEMSLLDGAPRAATVVAVTGGRLLRIPRPEFEALLDESPELSRGVIRTLLGHLRASAAY